MKNYSEYVSVIDITSFLWFCIFSLLIVKLTRSFSERNQLYFLVFFLIHCILSLVFIYSSPLPEFSDTHTFAKLVKATEWNIVQSKGVEFWFYLSYLFRLASGFSLVSYLFLQVFFFYLSVIMMLLAFENFENNKASNRSVSIYILLVSLFPSVLLYIDQPLREAWLLLGFSLSLFSISLIKLKGGKVKYINLLFIGCVLTILTRPQLIICYTLLYLFFIGVSRRNFIFIVVMFALSPFAFTALTGYDFEPAFFAYIRNSQISNSPVDSVYGSVEWNSFIDIIFDMPLLTLQFILSPLPILHNNAFVSMKALALVFLYMVVIFFFAAMSNSKSKYKYFLVYMSFSVIFSVWEFYIGAAIRHRFPLDLLFFPLAANYLSGVRGGDER
ncbi:MULTISPECIES: hypothetical protein [Vibrio]|uniref:hypothetical protein n=1 Tax=Vibrio TaxID=662 RepID=UPI0020C1A81F|nr:MULTISPECIES: hypothetical protein [Vibrio]MDW2326718.1 hypothetical protein [Vibrio sp. 1401]